MEGEGYRGGWGDADGRSFKQLRRGGNMGRGARFDGYGNGRGARPTQPPRMNPSSMPPPNFPSLPQMPNPPSGMPPLDPNNPMAALLTMQAMGFPIPGMPAFSPSGSPVGQPSPLAPRFSPAMQPQRCQDYDTKGFCARGNTCAFEHGTDSIYVPPSGMDGKLIHLLISLLAELL